VTAVLERPDGEREQLKAERNEASQRLTEFAREAVKAVVKYRPTGDVFDEGSVQDFERVAAKLLTWEHSFESRPWTRDEI
jgi:hypothetical protein